MTTYQKALLQMVAYRNIRASVQEVLDDYNLNTTQWIILGLVHDHPQRFRITDIASSLQVEGTLITNLTHRLVEAGYLKTTVSSADSRARLLALTPAGKTLVAKLEPELATHLKKLETDLPSTDLAGYFDTLQSFIDNSNPLPPDLV
jgi:MarR family transcriptional regulator for hemolysin